MQGIRSTVGKMVGWVASLGAERPGWLLQPFLQVLNDCEFRVSIVGKVGGEEKGFPICSTRGLDGKPCLQRMPNSYDWYTPVHAENSEVRFEHVHHEGNRNELIQVAKAVRACLVAAMPGSLPTVRDVMLRVDLCYAVAEYSDQNETSDYVWIINECDNPIIASDLMVDLTIDDPFREALSKALSGHIHHIYAEHRTALRM